MAVSLDSGDLSETPLAALLLQALGARATGALCVNDAGTHARVFVRDGLPAGAQSFASFRPLGQILVQQGRIDMDALSRSLAEMARSGRPQGEILVEMGVVSREDVARALSEQQAGYLRDISARGAGAYTWQAGLAPEWTRGLRLPPLRPLVAALQPPSAARVVEPILETAGAAVLSLAPEYAAIAHAFAWTPHEAALVERLRAGCDAAGFATASGDASLARAILAILLHLGLAVPRGAATAVAPAILPLAAAGVPADPRTASAAPPASPTSSALVETGGPRRAPTPAEAPPSPRPREDGGRDARQRLVERAVRNAGGFAQRPPSGAEEQREPAAARLGAAAAAELRSALQTILPRARERDLFARLGLSRTATRDQVKHAYLQLAKRFHPDRFLSPELADLQPQVQELFAAINEAYDVLGDDRRRTQHLATMGAAWVSEDASARVDYEKGEACLRTRDYARARGFLEAAARADARPEYLAAAAYAIVLEGRQSDREHARDLVRGALADPRCDRAAYVAGILARDDGDVAAAERHFRAALHANPRNAEAARDLRALEMRRAEKPRK